ncbi:DUF4892 domain-containing protein [Pseudomonas sp. F1_0610]|uniref:DUF4892 domain-containing protein n=1 Tax=Pseudomonas sp. F1_0610 TaxID=3114284 RepID=UPI0039C075EC
MRNLGASCLIGFLLIFTSATQAVTLEPKPLALRQSQLVFEQTKTVPTFTYPSSAVHRVAGKASMRNSVHTGGIQTEKMWHLASAYNAIDVFNEVRTALQMQGMHVLYWCTGRECGPSNLWANQIFNQAELYGPDDQQAYALLTAINSEANTQSLSAVYTVTRGNGRAYVYLNQVQMDEVQAELNPEPSTLLKQLKEDGVLHFLSLDKEPDERWVALFVQMLRQNSTLRVALQGDTADLWRDQMLAQGIASARIELAASEGEKGLSIRLMR